MMRNKWLAGAGTRALSLDMIESTSVCADWGDACVLKSESKSESSNKKEPLERQIFPENGQATSGACMCSRSSFSDDNLSGERTASGECTTFGEIATDCSADDFFEKTLVCLDYETLEHPNKLGFSAADHLDLPFVCRESFASRARASFSECEVTGALVYSANDMSGLNVAAMLKSDHPHKQVFLVADNDDEWLNRKLALAGIDGVVLAKHFYKELLTRHIKPSKEPQQEFTLQQDVSLQQGVTLQQRCSFPEEEVLQQNTVILQQTHTSADGETSFIGDVVPLEVYEADLTDLEEIQDIFPDGESFDAGIRPEDDIPASTPSGQTKMLPSAAREPLFVGHSAVDVIVAAGDVAAKDAAAGDAVAGDAVAGDAAIEKVANVQSLSACSVDDGFSPAGALSGKHPAFYLPIVGASGGVGKSTVAYLAALCSARLGCKTLLVDFDMQFGDLMRFSCVDQVMSLDEIATDREKLEHLEKGSDGFYLVGACSLPEQAEEVSGTLADVVDFASGLFDVVISNGPSYWNDQHMTLLEKAGKILFVLDQRFSALSAAQKAFDLCMRCGMAASPFLFLLNKCNRQAQLTYLDVTCAMQGSLCKEIPDGGRAVEEYFDTGQAGCLLDEKNDFACALFEIMADVLPGCSIPKENKREHRAPRLLFGRKHRKDDAQCL